MRQSEFDMKCDQARMDGADKGKQDAEALAKKYGYPMGKEADAEGYMEYEDYLEQCLDQAHQLVEQNGDFLFDSPDDDDEYDDDYRDPDDGDDEDDDYDYEDDDDPEINLTETEIEIALSEEEDQGYREGFTIKNFEEAFKESFENGYNYGNEDGNVDDDDDDADDDK